MMSNYPSFEVLHQNDFTTSQYADLLCLAKRAYRFVAYNEIPIGEKYVLWRHDIDYSLNRALHLAKIENAEGVKATYFINPHSEFYNILEKSQAQIIRAIIALGHQVALHFDAEYHDIKSETELDELIKKEAKLLQDWFGTKISAFSFHNPTPFLLSCENDCYGGLMNCYSRYFKSSVPYCSDSNGYWRFRRLRDVLESANDACLQVLTHPGWWQEEPMSPRERIFRCIDGRALAVMRRYDAVLRAHSRTNYGSLTSEFESLRNTLGPKANVLDHHWMRGEHESVFLDLWRILTTRLVKLSRIGLRKITCASYSEVRAVVGTLVPASSIYRLFIAVYGGEPIAAFGADYNELLAWTKVHAQASHGIQSYDKRTLEQGIVFVIRVMQHMEQYCEAVSNTLEVQDGIIEKKQLNNDACWQWLENNAALLTASDNECRRIAAGNRLKMEDAS